MWPCMFKFPAPSPDGILGTYSMFYMGSSDFLISQTLKIFPKFDISARPVVRFAIREGTRGVPRRDGNHLFRTALGAEPPLG